MSFQYSRVGSEQQVDATSIARKPAMSTETHELHPFERSGLGVAPFRYVSHERKVGPIMVGMSQVGAPGQPMGSCQHCGTGIADCFWVESADGKTFYVGSDCILKLYRESNRTASQLARDPFYQAFKKEKNRIATARRNEREAAKIAEGTAWALENQVKLMETKDPNRTERSLWDRYQWFQQNAGNAGKIKVIKELKHLTKGIPAPDSATIIMAGKKAAARAICDSLRKSERVYAAKRAAERYVVENGWLVRVLESAHQGDFVTSMIKSLERGAISDLSDRTISILRDIYGKHHGRRGSRKYEAAVAVFGIKSGCSEV